MSRERLPTALAAVTKPCAAEEADDALEEILLLVREDGDAWEVHCRNFKQPGAFEAWKTVRRRLVAALREYRSGAAATAPAGGVTPSTVFFPCVDDPDNSRLHLWELIDAYAEARHKHGAPEYSEVAHAARVKVLAALTTAARAAEPEKYDDTLLPFLALMRRELHANSAKGDRPGWLSMTPDKCLLEIYWHVSKLSVAVRDGDPARVAEHCADVANMAMMQADIAGLLPSAPTPEGEAK